MILWFYESPLPSCQTRRMSYEHHRAAQRKRGQRQRPPLCRPLGQRSIPQHSWKQRSGCVTQTTLPNSFWPFMSCNTHPKPSWLLHPTTYLRWLHAEELILQFYITQAWKTQRKAKLPGTYSTAVLISDGSCIQTGQDRGCTRGTGRCIQSLQTFKENLFPERIAYCQAHAQSDESWSDKLQTRSLSHWRELLPRTELREDGTHCPAPSKRAPEFHPLAQGQVMAARHAAILHWNPLLRWVHLMGTSGCLQKLLL